MFVGSKLQHFFQNIQLQHFRFKELQTNNKQNLFVIMANPNRNLTTRYGKDLHVFILDNRNLNKSLDHFVELYAVRTKKNNEFWLLDITDLGSAKKVSENKLKKLPNLDLNDDLYIFEGSDEELKIWELYEIQPSMPRILQLYGTWKRHSREGIQLLKNENKWIRRKDLQVWTSFYVASCFIS